MSPILTKIISKESELSLRMVVENTPETFRIVGHWQNRFCNNRRIF